MKIKYECVEVRKYAGCEVVILDVHEGRKQQEGSNPTALHITMYSLSDGVTYTPNPEWGKHIPGEIYWVDITLAEPA